jgi:hypothetical protein
MLDDKRKFGAVLIGGLVLIIAAILLLGGGQTSTILSKVGAAVSNETVGSAAGSTNGDAAGSGNDGPPQVDAVPAAATTLLIVRTGTLTLETGTIVTSVSDAARLVSTAGGFVAGSKESGTGPGATAVVEYRIPAAAWEPTLAALRDLGGIRDQEIKSQEVTGTVADLGARIANLRATERSLQAIMARAARIQDVLDVQKQLTDTRGQIEQLTAQESGLRDRAAFGSLTVTFQLPAPAPTARRTPVWDPATDVGAATATLVRVGQRGTSVAIWVAIVGVPILLVALIALAVAWSAYRLATRRSRRSRAVI